MNIPKRGKPEQPKINGFLLKYVEIRLLDSEGNQLGIFKAKEALKLAKTQDLDLVLITDTCNPVVAKITDYGKYKYELSKSQKSTKAKTLENKNFQVKPNTAINDLQIVARKIREALEKGHTVTLQCFFRKAQLSHPELGKEKIDKVLELIKDYELISSQPLKGNKIIVSLKKR